MCVSGCMLYRERRHNRRRILSCLPLKDHFQKTPQGICCTHHHKNLVSLLPQRQQPKSYDPQVSCPPPSLEPAKPEITQLTHCIEIEHSWKKVNNHIKKIYNLSIQTIPINWKGESNIKIQEIIILVSKLISELPLC